MSALELAGTILDLLITGSLFCSVFGAALWAGINDGGMYESFDEDASICGIESPIITL